MIYLPLSGELGTCRRFNARFWPGLSISLRSGCLSRRPPHKAPCTLYRMVKGTLHPTPYTLHPAPYKAPHTLHPTPNTLHPTPYTLHPTPYTLHPTPYTHLHSRRAMGARISIVRLWLPLSSEHGTHTTVNAKFWSSLPDENPSNRVGQPLSAGGFRHPGGIHFCGLFPLKRPSFCA